MAEDKLRTRQSRGLLPHLRCELRALDDGQHGLDAEGRGAHRHVLVQHSAVASAQHRVHLPCNTTGHRRIKKVEADYHRIRI